MRSRRLPRALLATAVLVSLAGCAGETAASSGPDIGFCAAWAAVDRLPEPSPHDADEMRRFARRFLELLEDLDTDEDVDDEPLPEAVLDDLETAATALERFVARLDAGGEARALAEFTRSPFNAATSRLTDFEVERCTR